MNAKDAQELARTAGAEHVRASGMRPGSGAAYDARGHFEAGFARGWEAAQSVQLTRHPGQPRRPFLSLTYPQRLRVLSAYESLGRTETFCRWQDRGRAHAWAQVDARFRALICDAVTWDMLRGPYPPAKPAVAGLLQPISERSES